MDRDAAARVIAPFEGRGQLDRLGQVDAAAAHACLGRAKERLAAATLLIQSQHGESGYTTAYDAYRTGADAVVLSLG